MGRKIEKKEIMATMLSTIIAFTLIIAVNLTPARAQESPIEVWSDYTLDRDMTFSDDGFIVKANNVTLNLNGHTITGSGEGIGIHCYETNGVIVKNGEILNFHFGIYLSRSSNNTISGNNITDNDIGIYLFGSNNVLRDNSISNNQYNFDVSPSANDIDTSNTINGRPICYWVDERDKVVPVDSGFVALVNCTRITVQDLNLTNNGQGVLLAFTNKSTIAKNDITNNLRGIQVFKSSDNNISGNNIANNEDGIQLEDSSNYNSISGNNITANTEQGIKLSGIPPSLGPSNNSISRNSITSNLGGIWLYWSSDNNVSGNNITENTLRGIGLYTSSDNNVSGNKIMSNNGCGIWLGYSSDNNTISGNNIADNEDGIGLWDACMHNIVYHNNFANNSRQVYSYYSTNVWDDGYPSGGNYWSDLNPPDGDRDKIGDVPCIMDDDNSDEYPLVYPYDYVPSPDVNDDGIVDIFDVVTVANAFGCIPGDPDWNPLADINGSTIEDLDEIIDIFDIVTIAKNFGKTT